MAGIRTRVPGVAHSPGRRLPLLLSEAEALEAEGGDADDDDDEQDDEGDGHADDDDPLVAQPLQVADRSKA